jgi:hypothetical protein
MKRVLEHLNTVADFTRYFNKRAAFIRSGKLAFAPGEEDLLAFYLHVGIFSGEYDFDARRKKKLQTTR